MRTYPLTPKCKFLIIALLFSFIGSSQSGYSHEQRKTYDLGYRHIQTDTPQSIHILEIDPHQFHLIPARALNDGLGRETVSSICSRCGAAAAINGGYFSIGGSFDGSPSGALKIGPNWFSLSKKQRGAIGWMHDGTAAINRISLRCSLRIGGSAYRIDGLNQARSKGKAILYTWAFHRSTLTNPRGAEIAIKDGKVIEIRKHKGDTVLPIDGFVYSADSAAGIDLDRISTGMPAEIAFDANPLDSEDAAVSEFWSHCDYIVGGAGILIRDGLINKDYQAENLLNTFIIFKHPRTAIGIKANGTWVLAVVDGRQPNLSRGLTLLELATLMKSLGCVHALNLDGGGSSTMVIDGNLVNSPTGDEDEGLTDAERRVSDAILIIPKA